MVKIVDGKPVVVPDDNRITPQMKDMRIAMNTFLRWMSSDSPEIRKLREQFRRGHISSTSFQWFHDPD